MQPNKLPTLLLLLLLTFGLVPALAQKPAKQIAKPTTHHKKVNRKSTPTKAKPAKDTISKVWVNTKSGVYHMPGQRWYGATKQGEYMTEKEALAHGYTHTHNGQ